MDYWQKYCMYILVGNCQVGLKPADDLLDIKVEVDDRILSFARSFSLRRVNLDSCS